MGGFFLLLADATAPHDNRLFDNWGMVGVIVTLCLVVPSVVVWLWQRKTDETRIARVQIRTALSGLFQLTVAGATREVFAQIADLLPDLLAQPRKDSERSTFEHLCAQLVALEKQRSGEGTEGPGATIPTQSGLGDVLRDVLAAAIRARANRLIDQMEQDASEGAEEAKPHSGVRIPISAESEARLEFLAEQMAKANRCEKRYVDGRRRAMRCYLAAIVPGVLTIGGVLIDTTWAFWALIGMLSLVVTLLVTGTGSLLLAVEGDRWLRDTVAQFPSAADWHNHFKKRRGG